MNQHDPLLSPRCGVTELSRILGLPPSTVRRWVLENQDDERRPVMASFLELVEMYVIAELMRLGAQPEKIRSAVREGLKLSHPLARESFLMEGANLWERQNRTITHLGHGGRRGLFEIVKAAAADIDFDIGGLAKALYPAGRDRGIVIIPGVASGRPLIATKHAPTWALAGRVKAGDTPAEVAAEFDVAVADVEAAVAYEQSLRCAAPRERRRRVPRPLCRGARSSRTSCAPRPCPWSRCPKCSRPTCPTTRGCPVDHSSFMRLLGKLADAEAQPSRAMPACARRYHSAPSPPCPTRCRSAASSDWDIGQAVRRLAKVLPGIVGETTLARGAGQGARVRGRNCGCWG